MDAKRGRERQAPGVDACVANVASPVTSGSGKDAGRVDVDQEAGAVLNTITSTTMVTYQMANGPGQKMRNEVDHR